MKLVDSTEGLDMGMLCLSGSVLCLLLCHVLLHLEESVGYSVPQPSGKIWKYIGLFESLGFP